MQSSRRRHSSSASLSAPKVALLPLYEPTDKDVALMDKCDGNIGDGLVRTLLNLFAEDGRVKNAFNVR